MGFMFFSLDSRLTSSISAVFAKVAILCRLLAGLANCAGYPVALALLCDHFEAEELSTAMGFYHAGAALGGLVGFAVGGSLVSAYGWRWAFGLVGAPQVLVALLLCTVRHRERLVPDAGCLKAARRGLRGVSCWWQGFGMVFRTFWDGFCMAFGHRGLASLASKPLRAPAAPQRLPDGHPEWPGPLPLRLRGAAPPCAPQPHRPGAGPRAGHQWRAERLPGGPRHRPLPPAARQGPHSEPAAWPPAKSLEAMAARYIAALGDGVVLLMGLGTVLAPSFACLVGFAALATVAGATRQGVQAVVKVEGEGRAP